jgi:DNA-binding CsgD family transcriptional regulator
MTTVLLDRVRSTRQSSNDCHIEEISKNLRDIARRLYDLRSLPVAEEALDETRDILGLPWACWNSDTSRPSSCPEAIQYGYSRGWPHEAMDLWQDPHVPLKMSMNIRCRSEHLPFVTELGKKIKQRVSSKYSRLDEALRKMGMPIMLTVPIHLPKGQVGMIGWNGALDKKTVEGMLSTISGDLLAIGHHFMRVYREQSGYSPAAAEELSHLTPREWDCLRTLAQGYREAEIADILGILKSTVHFHLHNVIRKFGCKNRTQAIALAAQLGILGPIGP